jgi:hypothetical protein
VEVHLGAQTARTKSRRMLQKIEPWVTNDPLTGMPLLTNKCIQPSVHEVLAAGMFYIHRHQNRTIKTNTDMTVYRKITHPAKL